MIRALAIVCVLASTAAADKLDEARAAVNAVRYDDAQRLLVDALAQGTAYPEKLYEIYRLSAITAVVLGQPEAAEQFYRRWIALDPKAALGDDVAPKLRAPFDAAKAYIAAHGRFEVSLARGDHEIRIEVRSDPLDMARFAAYATPSSPTVAIGADHRAVLPVGLGGEITVAVTDEYGNHLSEVVSPDPLTPDSHPRQPVIPRHHERHTGALLGWGIPCVVALGTGAGFGIAALYENSKLGTLVDNSKDHYYSEVDDRKTRRAVFTALGGSLFGAGALLAIPTAIYLSRRGSPDELGITPYASDSSTGFAVSGRF